MDNQIVNSVELFKSIHKHLTEHKIAPFTVFNAKHVLADNLKWAIENAPGRGNEKQILVIQIENKHRSQWPDNPNGFFFQFDELYRAEVKKSEYPKGFGTKTKPKKKAKGSRKTTMRVVQ